MSILFTNGCSFAVGHELKDTSRVARWSNLVAKELGMFDCNEGKIGGSNQRIQRTTINAILGGVNYVEKRKQVTIKSKKYPNGAIVDFADNRFEVGREKPALAIIMWTGVNRWEHLNGARDNPAYKGRFPYHWQNVNWNEMKYDPKTLLPGINSEVKYDPWVSPEFRKYGRDFMLTRNLLWCLKDTINCMLSVKYFLQAQGIPQLHYTWNKMHYSTILEVLNTETWEAANIMWRSLDLDKKQVLKELPFLNEDGFFETTRKGGFPLGKLGHPLEEGHAAMAERILKDYEALKKVSE